MHIRTDECLLIHMLLEEELNGILLRQRVPCGRGCRHYNTTAFTRQYDGLLSFVFVHGDKTVDNIKVDEKTPERSLWENVPAR